MGIERCQIPHVWEERDILVGKDTCEGNHATDQVGSHAFGPQSIEALELFHFLETYQTA